MCTVSPAIGRSLPPHVFIEDHLSIYSYMLAVVGKTALPLPATIIFTLDPF